MWKGGQAGLGSACKGGSPLKFFSVISSLLCVTWEEAVLENLMRTVLGRSKNLYFLGVNLLENGLDGML